MVAVCLASVGLVVTAFVTVIYWLNYDTPIVKASSRELTFITMIGMFGAHVSTLPMVALPDPVTCGIAYVLPAVSLAAVFSSLATKTNRIARILAVNKKRIRRRNLKFISWSAQVRCRKAIFNRPSYRRADNGAVVPSSYKIRR
jgi:7 transmembrane sweet-taste receptor of 3 GCPR